ncbi:MAG: hypothetical protein MUF45_05535 [Spirosomaceae bacterium]|jgi:rRNA-processing protein FCF1|nr:hypothetical protein [Spirosomataceae bacterium]
MKIAITDTNIFIDCIKIGFLEYLFEIDYEIHTTEFVLNEFHEHQKQILDKFIQSGNLLVKTFDADELETLINLDVPSGLSSIDKGVFYFATLNEKYEVFTNDGLLRKTCQKNGIQIHGIIWIFDKLIEKKKVTPPQAIQALEKLIRGYHRLPLDECRKRFNDWRAII